MQAFKHNLLMNLKTYLQLLEIRIQEMKLVLNDKPE